MLTHKTRLQGSRQPIAEALVEPPSAAQLECRHAGQKLLHHFLLRAMTDASYRTHGAAPNQKVLQPKA
jgi:hypothetical protein